MTKASGNAGFRGNNSNGVSARTGNYSKGSGRGQGNAGGWPSGIPGAASGKNRSVAPPRKP